MTYGEWQAETWISRQKGRLDHRRNENLLEVFEGAVSEDAWDAGYSEALEKEAGNKEKEEPLPVVIELTVKRGDKTVLSLGLNPRDRFEWLPDPSGYVCLENGDQLYGFTFKPWVRSA